MSRGLAGKRIVVTRAREQAAELGELLSAQGAQVIYCPAIRFAAPRDARPFQQAVSTLARFDWVIVTSVNGVAALLAELERQGATATRLRGLRIACVGPATADALRRHGLEPAAIPEDFVGAEIATVLADAIRADQRSILLVRGAGGDPKLPRRLRELGALVTEVECYQSVPDLDNLTQVREELAAGAIDLVTFTSPSTATYFLEGVGPVGAAVAVAAIGPVTAARLRELGRDPDIVAAEHTMSGLVQAVSSFYSDRGS